MPELSSTLPENEPREMNIKKRPGESPAVWSLQGALVYLAVLNWDSENGLSLETRGRLKLGTTPRSA